MIQSDPIIRFYIIYVAEKALLCTGRNQQVHTTFWLEGLEARSHFEELSVNGRFIIDWFLGK
jgi:hypothetical protein